MKNVLRTRRWNILREITRTGASSLRVLTLREILVSSSTRIHLTLLSRSRKCNYILHALTRASRTCVTHIYVARPRARAESARAIVHVCVHRVTNMRAWVRVSRARRARVIRVGEAKRVSSVLVLVSWQSLSTTTPTTTSARSRRRRRRRRRRQRWRWRRRQRRRRRWSLSLSLSLEQCRSRRRDNTTWPLVTPVSSFLRADRSRARVNKRHAGSRLKRKVHRCRQFRSLLREGFHPGGQGLVRHLARAPRRCASPLNPPPRRVLLLRTLSSRDMRVNEVRVVLCISEVPEIWNLPRDRAIAGIIIKRPTYSRFMKRQREREKERETERGRECRFENKLARREYLARFYSQSPIKWEHSLTRLTPIT